jgi:hypothetical protein
MASATWTSGMLEIALRLRLAGLQPAVQRPHFTTQGDVAEDQEGEAAVAIGLVDLEDAPAGGADDAALAEILPEGCVESAVIDDRGLEAPGGVCPATASTGSSASSRRSGAPCLSGMVKVCSTTLVPSASGLLDIIEWCQLAALPAGFMALHSVSGEQSKAAAETQCPRPSGMRINSQSKPRLINSSSNADCITLMARTPVRRPARFF